MASIVAPQISGDRSKAAGSELYLQDSTDVHTLEEGRNTARWNADEICRAGRGAPGEPGISARHGIARRIVFALTCAQLPVKQARPVSWAGSSICALLTQRWSFECLRLASMCIGDDRFCACSPGRFSIQLTPRQIRHMTPGPGAYEPDTSVPLVTDRVIGCAAGWDGTSHGRQRGGQRGEKRVRAANRAPHCTGFSPDSCECGCAVRRCPFGKSKSPAHSIPVQVPVSRPLAATACNMEHATTVFHEGRILRSDLAEMALPDSLVAPSHAKRWVLTHHIIPH